MAFKRLMKLLSRPDRLPSASGRTPYRVAIRREKETRRISRWPRRGEDNRLEPEAWPDLQPKFSLTEARSIFTIGSCFARNIEEGLHARGFIVPTLDFAVPKSEWSARANGILNKYTPANIWQELEWTLRAMDAAPARREALLAEHLVDVGDGRVIDLEMSGLIPVTRARGLERRGELLALNRRMFDCDVVVVTPGLCEAWWDAARGRHVEEMPPRSLADADPDRFHWRMLDFAAAHRDLTRAVELLRRHGKPGVKMLFTVSPVPLKRTFSGQDILVANTFAKSTLRAAVGQLAAEHDDVAYVPSYESVTLSRAPEVWTDDLRHVSGAFVDRIVGRLVEAYFTPAAGDARGETPAGLAP